MKDFELKVLAVARGGDTVFIKCENDITEEQWEAMEKQAELITFKHDIKVVILERCSVQRVERLH